MILEKDVSNQVDGMVRFQRPALALFAHVGKGPVRGVYQTRGILTNDYLAVSGSLLHRITQTGTVSTVGACSAQGLVQFAASAERVLIATGGLCYSYDGTTLTTVKMPNGEDVVSVEYLDGYFILVAAHSQHFFWIAPGETNPDALSFASAESAPDGIACVKRLGDELWFFGSGSTTEVWTPTGDNDLPFQRQTAMLFEQGCANRDTVTKLDNTLFWVGTDSKVYRAAQVPTRISDNSIEELLYETPPGDLRAWPFSFQGHAFYCLTIGDAGTRVYDVSTQQWSEFSTYGQTSWQAHVGVQTTGRTVIAGDDQQGILWQLDPERSNDNGKPLVRELMGGVPIIGQAMPCSSFSIVAATGHGNTVKPGADPVIEVRWSDDGGNLWSDWRQIKLGKKGRYGQEVALTRLGMIVPPGRLFHVRATEDSPFRVSYARVNEWGAF